MTPWTRRKFLEVSALVSGAVATNAANIAGADQSLVPSAIVPPLDGITPAGSLAEKIKLSAERLTLRGTPAYTDPMVLADVTLDTRRRFANFSNGGSTTISVAFACITMQMRPTPRFRAVPVPIPTDATSCSARARTHRVRVREANSSRMN